MNAMRRMAWRRGMRMVCEGQPLLGAAGAAEWERRKQRWMLVNAGRDSVNGENGFRID